VILIRILIVDPSLAWRTVVAAILRRAAKWQIVGEACDGFEAVRLSEELQPDLILLSSTLPRIHGFEAAREIGVAAPHSKILFLSECASPESLAVAVMMGAYGVLLKSEAAIDLVPAIEAVLQGTRFVSGGLV
jgi:DNA-binding NarL/FixJ family response regulator